MLLDFFNGNFDFMEFVTTLLISLPGILLALSLHEAAHAYVALRCGDPTAQMLGRVTVNPAKHIDPIGFLMMLLVGVGWARPVPVNPRNFRKYRRDDLLVSIAGIAVNLLQFVVGCVVLYGITAFALSRLTSSMHLLDAQIQLAFAWPYFMTDQLIVPTLGATMGYVYRMVLSYTVINISLAAFNLLPVPPLDGYHVLNDLVLKRPLFASGRAAQLGRLLILALVFTDVLDKGLNYVVTGSLQGMGNLAYAVLHALRIF